MNNIFEYAISSLLRGGAKNFFINLVFIFLVFLSSSVIFVVTSLKSEVRMLVFNFPNIVISKNVGGRRELIDEKFIDEFLEFPAVFQGFGRVWGEYRFKNEQGKFAYVSILGLNPYENGYGEILDSITENLNTENMDENFMITSPSVMEFLKNQIGVYEAVPFFTPENFLILTKPVTTLNTQSSLFNNDVVILSEKNAREILGVDEGKFTDIVLFLQNDSESEFVANKISTKHPEFRVLTKSEILKKIELLYDFKAGFFLSIMMICALGFGIILFDKLSGLKSEERREIAILRAIGWDVDDIMKAKIYESLIFSVSAFLIGITLSIFYVYFAGAPILTDILDGFGGLKIAFNLKFYFDFKIFALLFFLCVPLYISICLIPAFKVATMDIDEAIK